MPQSLSMIYIHMVYSTKHRIPLLRNKSLRSEMHRYLAGSLKTLECVPILVGGHDDHIHALFQTSRMLGIAKIVGETKRVSSIWAKTRDNAWRDYAWQHGYGAFSVSHSLISRAVKYIENQEEHHKTVTFQEEFRKLLKKHGIEFDERYVWD
jgi:putative transposase